MTALPVSPSIHLTKDSVLELDPCRDWREGGIDRYLAGRESIPLAEVLLDERRELISEDDQRWLVAALLGDRSPEWARRCADHVVQRALDAGHGDAAWRAWARRWLSGEDRTAETAAESTAKTAWAAWSAARAAAEEARDARMAWAARAARAAEAATWAAESETEHRWQMIEAIRMIEEVTR